MCICQTVFGQNSEIKMCINKYDVWKAIKDIPKNTPVEFWKAVVDNNNRVKSIMKALDKEDKTLLESMNAIDYFFSNANIKENTTFKYHMEGRKLFRDLGVERVLEKQPVKFIINDDLNANMDAVGQMRIYTGCMDRLSYEELLAVCAHETAHFMCQHVLSRIWKSAKKEKRNKMWADIGASLFIGTMAATSGYAGANGQDVTHFNNIIANADIIYYGAYDYANDASLNYEYRYNRDEEAEADIIAYRFMEYMGYETNIWLSVLRKIAKDDGRTTLKADKKEDHPTPAFRIKMIEMMQSGYKGK